MDKQDNEDVKLFRNLFWRKFRGEITQSELELFVEQIMNRQLILPEVRGKMSETTTEMQTRPSPGASTASQSA